MTRVRRTAALVATASMVMMAACTPDEDGPQNASPVAVATATATSVRVQQSVGFSGVDSTDPDGTVVSWQWDFGDGTTASGPVVAHAWAAPGTFTVNLTVTDDGGAWSMAAPITVTVSAGGSVRWVSPTGSDAGDCDDPTSPCATISYAVGRAGDGDTVEVSAGVYDEVVPVSKALAFRGANAGIPAGVGASERGPESVVRGFRTTPSAANERDTVIDGFTIDPTGDPALLGNATGIVNLFGGESVSIVNNVFIGAPALVPDCSHTCSSMGDYAVHVRSGGVVVADNRFRNWRRPVNLQQVDPGRPLAAGLVANNSFSGVTSRAVAVGASIGNPEMAGVVVAGNDVDGTGRGPLSNPAGVAITSRANVVAHNTFRGLATGVFVHLCKAFRTDANRIERNRFVGNAAGVTVTTLAGEGGCNPGAGEGAGSWVIGGGTASGLRIVHNSFEGHLAWAVRFNPDWGPNPPAVTGGSLDATCNWWGSAAGPGSGDVLGAPAGEAVLVTAPWRTSDGGPCDGGR